MDLRLKTCCVIVAAFSVVRSCRLNAKPTLSNISERLVNNTAVDDFLNDYKLNAGWYRVTNNGRLYTLADISTDISTNVSYGMCGTFYPILLKDMHPNLSSVHFDNTDLKACAYDDNGACSVEYNLRIRRCGPDLEYYLQSAVPYSAYCLVPQCEQGLYGSNCQHACQCKAPGTNFCFPDTGECECNTGFHGPLCENDVDECVTGMHNCSSEMVCYNSLGSYKCMCRDGWTFDNASAKCILPVRACRLNNKPTLNNISQRLVNNTAVEDFLNDYILDTGWFRVTNNGRLYTLADSSSNVSYGMCGTFYPIFLKDVHPKLSSIHFDYTDVKACAYEDNTACNIEYNLRMRRCGPDLEYYLQSAVPYSAYCLVPQCEQGFYGTSCRHACQCTDPGTHFCFPDTGECECNTGFHGPLCENDVDECVTAIHNCSSDMVCYNTLGSFKCMCRDGWTFDNASDKCILPECSDDSYGIGCSLRCRCNIEHSFRYKLNQYCNPLLGHCTCKEGWTGFTCDADIDECTDTDMCNTDRVCKNFPGTFSCECNEGYSNEDGKCISDPKTSYTAVIISASVVLVAILVIAASITLWKCKGIRPTRWRTAPEKNTGTGDSSIDIHSNDYSCIDDIGNLKRESDHVYERYTKPAENTRMDHSKDIFIVRDNFCSSSYFDHSFPSHCHDEHVYLSIQENRK